MCCSRVQGHAQAGSARFVPGHADDASREVAFVLIPGGEERGVRAAVAERHAEPLRIADGDVGAPLPGGDQERQRQQVGGGGHQRPRRMRRRAQLPVVSDGAVAGRVLHQRSDHAAAELEGGRLGDHDLDATRFGTRAHHGDGLRMAGGVHQEHARSAAALADDGCGEMHRLRGRRALVEQRRVGDFQARQVRHHRLKIEERLEPALGDLGLVGRVRRVPARILEHVAQDHRRRDAIVVTHP